MLARVPECGGGAYQVSTPIEPQVFTGPGSNGPQIYGLHSSWYHGHGCLTLSPGMLKPEVQNTIHSHFVFSYIFENLITSESEGCLPKNHGIPSTPSTLVTWNSCPSPAHEKNRTAHLQRYQEPAISLGPLPRPACSPGSL